MRADGAWDDDAGRVIESRVLSEDITIDGAITEQHAHSVAANYLMQERRETYQWEMGRSALDVSEGDKIWLRVPDQGIDVCVRVIQRLPKDSGGAAEYSGKRYVRQDYAWIPTPDRLLPVAPQTVLPLPAPVPGLASYDDATLTFRVTWSLPVGLSAHALVSHYEILLSVDAGPAEVIGVSEGMVFEHTPPRLGLHVYAFSVRSIGLEDTASDAVAVLPQLPVNHRGALDAVTPPPFAMLIPLDRRVTVASMTTDGVTANRGNPSEAGDYRFLERATSGETPTRQGADISNWDELFARADGHNELTLRVCPIDADNENQYYAFTDIPPHAVLTYFPETNGDLPDYRQWMSLLVVRRPGVVAGADDEEVANFERRRPANLGRRQRPLHGPCTWSLSPAAAQ